MSMNRTQARLTLKIMILVGIGFIVLTLYSFFVFVQVGSIQSMLYFLMLWPASLIIVAFFPVIFDNLKYWKNHERKVLDRLVDIEKRLTEITGGKD